MREGVDQFLAAKKGDPDGLREWIFANAMPNMDDMREGLVTVNVLTLPSKNTIDKLDENYATNGKEAYAKFKEELDRIGKDINARNKKNRSAGKAVYHYLHPTVIPASIDI